MMMMMMMMMILMVGNRRFWNRTSLPPLCFFQRPPQAETFIATTCNKKHIAIPTIQKGLPNEIGCIGGVCSNAVPHLAKGSFTLYPFKACCFWLEINMNKHLNSEATYGSFVVFVWWKIGVSTVNTHYVGISPQLDSLVTIRRHHSFETIYCIHWICAHT